MKIFILLFTLIFSLSSFASCLDRIQERRDNFEFEEKTGSGVGGVGGALTAGLVVSGGVFGAVFVGAITLGVSGAIYIHANNLFNLQTMITEAHDFEKNQVAGKMLKRALRKIQRRVDKKIEMSELAQTIIHADETETLCDVNSIRKFSKAISITLESDSY